MFEVVSRVIECFLCPKSPTPYNRTCKQLIKIKIFEFPQIFVKTIEKMYTPGNFRN